MDGVLVVDKPQGPTSHDVVAIVRRLPGVERAGHAGTLDPLATGVLALVIGRATRLASFLSGTDKEYEARVRFGASTETYDAETAPTDTDRFAPAPTERAIADVLPRFTGTYLQQPPPFSAKKIGGIAAYALARKGKPVDIKPSLVTVHALELSAYADGVAELEVVCSSGFYVRSLAHDLGQQLGCGAFLESLRRTRSGDFTLRDAVSLEAIAGGGSAVRDRVLPMARLLPGFPAVTLTPDGVARASHGNALSARDFVTPLEPASEPPADPSFRLLDPNGSLVGIARRAGGILHPTIVLV
ncbi:MAG TPA: tRNA pseudouridine(55) synthase TruB [Vicinamibacterales bacterium]